MTDLKIIQEVFGNHEVSEKWLINMFEVCRRIRAAEREACAKVCDEYDVAEDVCSSDTAEGIAAAICARGRDD